VQKILRLVLVIALSTVFLSPITINAANESTSTLTTCTSLKTGHTYISIVGNVMSVYMRLEPGTKKVPPPLAHPDPLCWT